MSAAKRIYITPSDAAYPAWLRTGKKFYMAGEILPCDAQAIAIVGTREPTEQAKEHAYQMAFALAKRGVTIVSGLARGVDTAAHWGALHAGGRTIAVVGSGLDCIYPAENGALAEMIATHGAVVSEYEMGAKPERRHFLQRNGMIVNLSSAVVLIEARVRSGSLHTARMAVKKGIPLFAQRSDAEGNQESIKKYKAISVENAEEVLTKLNDRVPHQLLFDWVARIGV